MAVELLLNSLIGLHLRALTGPCYLTPALISDILLSVPKLKTRTNPSEYPQAAMVSSWLNLVTMSSGSSEMTAFMSTLFLRGIFSMILGECVDTCERLWSICFAFK